MYEPGSTKIKIKTQVLEITRNLLEILYYETIGLNTFCWQIFQNYIKEQKRKMWN